MTKRTAAIAIIFLSLASPGQSQQLPVTHVPDARLPNLLYLQQVAVAASGCHLRDAIVFNRIFDAGQEIERSQNLDGRVAIDLQNTASTRANAAFPDATASTCDRLAASRDLRQMDALYSAIMADKVP